jgi:hypothetical protein
MRMPAAFLCLQDVHVALFTGLMASEDYRKGGYVGQSVRAIVSVLPEALRHQGSTHPQERQSADQENNGYTKYVPGVFEGIHGKLPSQIPQFVASPLCAGSQRSVFMATGTSDLWSKHSGSRTAGIDYRLMSVTIPNQRGMHRHKNTWVTLAAT